jgi:alpha-D-xyloside xylohydrolase
MNRFFIVPAVICALAVSVRAQESYRITSAGVTVTVSDTLKNGPKLVMVQPITDRIIRVRAVNADSFPNIESLMIRRKTFPEVEWSAAQSGDSIILKTSSLHVKISTRSGRVAFYDTTDHLILSEIKGGGKTLEPASLKGGYLPYDGPALFRVRDQFESTSDEAFYGLGQQQEGVFNYKGYDVDLYQYNTKISIPFVVSSRHYGILWDNYSRSKFGDPREYQSISQLTLYDAEGNQGGLTATYFDSLDTSKVFTARRETEINYEFLPDLKKFPSGYSLSKGVVTWTGSFEPDSSGLWKFRLYASGLCKIWISNELLVDRWRQSWNAFVYLFNLQLEKGHHYPIRIEWIPSGSEAYMALKVKTPVSIQEQDELSLYSEYARQIDYYFVYGRNMDEVISGYRQLTGKALIPPKWALGFWQSRERYATQDQLLQVARKYRKLRIPFDNIVQDWFYWKEDQWGSMEFDSSRYPNPKAMVDEVHKLHEHIMISVWAKFYKGIANFDTMMKNGYLYRGNLSLGNRDWVGKGYLSTFYDAFNPSARKLFWKMIDEKLYPLGIDAWWLDSDEPDIQSNLSMDTREYLMDPTYLGPGAEYFNAYPLEHCRGVFHGLMSENPNGRVFILSRSAYAGSQRYGVAVWSGDVASTWNDLKGQIPAGLNYSISGLPYWTFDIGGFAVPDKFIDAKGAALDEWRELLTRWYEFGAFCPIYRSHGQYPFREIFNVAPEGSIEYDAMVNVTKLRYRLMPYIYSLAGMVYFDDYTIMRALVMDFPNDENVKNISTEYMFGPSILVAPVTEYKERKKEIYLPSGYGWYDLYTGKYYEGGRTITVDAPLNRIPLFVKEGSIIPAGPEIQYAEEGNDGKLTLYVYGDKNAEFTLYEDENENNNYQNGVCSMIPIRYDARNQSVSIGPTKGTYPGMLSKRTFKIVFISKRAPRPFLTPSASAKSVSYENAIVKLKVGK